GACLIQQGLRKSLILAVEGVVVRTNAATENNPIPADIEPLGQYPCQNESAKAVGNYRQLFLVSADLPGDVWQLPAESWSRRLRWPFFAASRTGEESEEPHKTRNRLVQKQARAPAEPGRLFQAIVPAC